MSDVTLTLQQIESGEADAAERLMPLVYDELRKLAAAKLAAERPDHTVQATALVHVARGHGFAAIERWWEQFGHKRVPDGNRLRGTAD
jgi:hypothetical protein